MVLCRRDIHEIIGVRENWSQMKNEAFMIMGVEKIIWKPIMV